ncbi:MAG: beta-galactosidase [Candidatus Aminicenantes bacterium]|nr:MAG: beta-galactosidase [Candidatus Aminicenantes bacterium]
MRKKASKISRKKTFLLTQMLIIGIISGAFLLTGKDAGTEKDFFPVSVWYAGGKARAPMLEKFVPEKRDVWRKDLLQIKKLGFNTVRCWVEWTSNEEQEGNYDFRTLEAVADLAGEVGLKLIVQVYIDSAPEWVGRKFSDAKFVASNGLPVDSQSSPGFCFDHPGVREKILQFFSAAAKVVADKPAFYGWDLWSEPHIINWAEIYYLGNAEYLQFCYCPNTMARFRDWLREKYGSLDRLNEIWYRTFQEWEEVEPPRFGTILTYTDYIDWKEFISDKLAEDLRMKANAVRKVVPNGVVTSHSALPGLFSRPNWNGTPDDRKMAASVDFYGVSIYPKHAWTIEPWSVFFRSSGHDFARSMNWKNGGFYIGELQAGYGVFGMKLSLPVVGLDLRDWMWTAVGYGARAVNIYAYYPMSSGYESGGYGLIELDGKVTDRAIEAGKVARTITNNMDYFLNSTPPEPEIAILYNPLSHMVGGQQQFTGEGQPIGYNNLSESLQGTHRAFFEKNIRVDFLHIADLASDRAKGYKLLIAPYPVMMTKNNIQDLIGYVEEGGKLVAEARAGWNDERGFSSDIIPGGGLHEIFGCRETHVWPLQKPSELIVKISHKTMPFLHAGEKLDTLFFEEGFQLIDERSQVLAQFKNGDPAIVYSTYGKGEAVIVGSFIGSAYHHFQNPNNAKFFTGLAQWLGVSNPVDVVSSEDDVLVEARILEGDSYTILFGFNRGKKGTKAKFALSLPGQDWVARNMEKDAVIPLAFKDNKVLMEKELEPQEVWVVLIEQE